VHKSHVECKCVLGLRSISISKSQERQRLQNADETKVIRLAEESKVKTFEMVEIFQVREKFQAWEEEHR
jgi:hypothetical protein